MARTRISEAQVGAGLALVDETELSSAISAHVALADPHTQYMTDAQVSAAYAEVSHIHATGNLIKVSKTPGLGEFSTVAAAIASVTGASTTNRFLISVGPGEYLEPAGLTLPAYTYVSGLDPWNSAILKTTDLTNDFITVSPNSGLFNIGVSGPTTAGKSTIKQVASGTTKLYWLNIKEGSYGITLAPTSGAARCHCVGVVTDGPTVMNRLFNCDNPVGIGIFILMQSGPMSTTWTGTQPSAVYLNGSGSIAPYKANATIDLCQFRGTGYDALYVDNAGLARGISVSFAMGTTAIHVGPNGASKVDMHGSQIKPGSWTKDIWCESALGSVTYSGVATESKITIAEGSSFVGNFADSDPAIAGQVIYGELWIGNKNVKTPLASYIQADKNTGLVSGGGLSRGAGVREINVAAGLAFIDTTSGLKKVSWVDTVLTIPANTDKARIYINNLGVVGYSPSPIDKEFNVQLGETGTDASTILFLFDQTIVLPQFRPKLYEYMEKVIGPINVSGGAVTVNAVDGLKLDVQASSFFLTETENVTDAGTAISFHCWRRNGSGGWVVQSESQVDNNLWDDGSGTLLAVPAGKFTRPVLYVSKSSGGTEFHCIHGQEVFDTAVEATNNPVPPDVLLEHACRLAAIIAQQGNPTIVSIIDQRPRLGQMSSGSTSITNHNDLTGRDSATAHTQYQLLTGKNVANGYAGLEATGMLNPAVIPATSHGNQAGGTLHSTASTSVNGFMSSADKTKLDGIAAGATVNSTDAALKDRANHTGTQAISTVTSLQATLDSKEKLGSLQIDQIPAMSGTSLIPYDNTTPLISEGTQLSSVSITPIAVTSQLVVSGSILVDCSANARNIAIALFRGNTCIGTAVTNIGTGGRGTPLSFSFTDLTLGTFVGTPTTYSLRIGASSSSTWYVNSSPTSSTLFGGTLGTNSIIFKEYV